MPTIPGSAHPNIGLGLLSIAGGTVGYIRKGSTASLVAGVSLGSLLLTSGYMITKHDPYQGHVLATVTTSVMAIAMGQRYLSTGKIMPAGLMAGMGAAAVAYNISKAMEWAPSKSE